MGPGSNCPRIQCEEVWILRWGPKALEGWSIWIGSGLLFTLLCQHQRLWAIAVNSYGLEFDSLTNSKTKPNFLAGHRLFELYTFIPSRSFPQKHSIYFLFSLLNTNYLASPAITDRYCTVYSPEVKICPEVTATLGGSTGGSVLTHNPLQSWLTGLSVSLSLMHPEPCVAVQVVTECDSPKPPTAATTLFQVAFFH